ncbi:MAG: hypothetical protein QM214_04185 [Bacillota bacterium]|jgi:hypothetical protein|nr:hypothetical protein [Bacillota bacterium]
MKKSVLTKILFVLLIALLALSVVACGGKNNPPEDPDNGNNNGNGDEEEQFAKAQDINKVISGLGSLIQGLDDIEDEMYMDFAFIVEFDQNRLRIEVKADIDAENPDDNIVALKIHDLNATPSLLLGAYLVENVIYIDQGITATPGKSKFSNLDALELSQNLSKLPGFLAEQDFSGVTEMIDSITSMLDSVGPGLDQLIEENEVLKFEETDEEYRLIINSEGLGDFIYGLMGPDGILNAIGGGGEEEEEEDDAVLDGIISFVLDLLFGVDSIDELADADTENFPELSIVARRDGKDLVSGFSIDYEGTFDEDRGREEISFGFDAKFDSEVSGKIAIPNDLASYKESAIKVSLSIDLGLKDLFLKADIFVNPDLSGEITPSAYLVALDKDGEAIADLDAFYDGKVLSFDLAGLYDMLDVDYPEEGTMYFVDLVFADLFQEADEPENAAEENEEEEESTLPFELGDIVAIAIGKIDVLYEIVINTVFNKELNIDAATILNIVNNLFVKVEDGKKFDIEEDMVPYLEGVLAEFASDEFLDENPDATDAQKAQSVIFEITGANVSVKQLLTADGAGNAKIILGILEDALGLNLQILTGAKNDNMVLDFTLEIDLVELDDYNADMPNKEYTDAIDLNSVSEILGDADGKNIYYKEDPENPGERLIDEKTGEEVKGYFILDELLRLLEAYRAYQG